MVDQEENQGEIPPSQEPRGDPQRRSQEENPEAVVEINEVKEEHTDEIQEQRC